MYISLPGRSGAWIFDHFRPECTALQALWTSSLSSAIVTTISSPTGMLCLRPPPLHIIKRNGSAPTAGCEVGCGKLSKFVSSYVFNQVKGFSRLEIPVTTNSKRILWGVSRRACARSAKTKPVSFRFYFVVQVGGAKEQHMVQYTSLIPSLGRPQETFGSCTGAPFTLKAS